MRKSLLPAALVLALVSLALCGFGGPAPTTPPPPSDNQGDMTPSEPGRVPDVYRIEDFNDGDYTTPEWWKFDNVTPTVVSNSSYTGGDANVAKAVGPYSLNIKGKATNWYAGGVGTYFAKPKTDYAVYNALQMDVYGNGPGSGTMKIELLDDDNGNWQVEQDPKKSYAPVYDDVWKYELNINWKGWKRVTIPFADFEDANPGVGDDIWNPDQKGGSGGLLQIQLIALGAKKDGAVNFNVDNIELIK